MSSTTAGITFWSHSGGLANRLRGLVGYRAVADVVGVPFRLCWEPDWACDAEFSSLFMAGGWDLVTPRQRRLLARTQGECVCDEPAPLTEIWRVHASQQVAWGSFRDNAVKRLRDLRPLPGIAAAVDEFAARHRLHLAHGMHVRMTDNVRAYQAWADAPGFCADKVSRLEGFEGFLTDTLSQDPAARVFLATDNPAVEERILREWSSHIITFPKQYRVDVRRHFSWRRMRATQETQRTSTIQDALAELLLLSKCRTVVGTYFSSYSGMAALWGGKQLYMVLGDRYTMWWG